jgi:Tfp pilus assembly protein PilN
VTTQTLVGTPTLPSVNLLPPEIAEARRFKRVQLALGGAVLAALLAVVGLYYNSHSGVSAAQDGLTKAKADNVRLQRELTQYQNVTAMKDEVAASQANLELAMGPQVLWSHYLSDLSLILPGNVWLTTVQVNLTGPAASSGTGTIQGALPAVDAIGAISFQGSALTHHDVAALLTALAKEKGFSNPYFTSSAETVVPNTTKKVADFQATVDVTLKALSGRYLTPMAGE